MKALFQFAILAFFAQTGLSQRLNSIASLSDQKSDSWNSAAILKFHFSSKLDTLSDQVLHEMDSEVNNLTSKVDSLSKIHLPTIYYQKKLDSIAVRLSSKLTIQNPMDNINQKALNGFSKLGHRKDSLQKEINRKALVIQKKLSSRSSVFVDSLSTKTTGLLPSSMVNQPSLISDLKKTETGLLQQTQLDKSLNIPSIGLSTNLNLTGNPNQISNNPVSGELNQLNKTTKNLSNPVQINPVTSEINKLENIPKQELANNPVVKSLGVIKNEEQKLVGLERQTEAYKQDIKKIRTGDVQQLQAVPKEIENAAVNRSELNGFKTEVAKVETTKNVLQQYQASMLKLNEGKLDAKDKDLVKKELADHFAGQEAKLQIGIGQLDKLKKKYQNIPDSRYLPKYAPNLLKGKPFKERFVPGINFQVFKNDYAVIDLSPFSVYRITSRIRTGVGVTYRLNIDTHSRSLVQARRAYGIRTMADFQLVPGLSLHGEGEWLNFAPYDPMLQKQADPTLPRKWIPGLYVGILKSYKVSRLINGNFQALYNFLYEKNGLYQSKFNMRFGFEFNLNRKKLMFVPASPSN